MSDGGQRYLCHYAAPWAGVAYWDSVGIIGTENPGAFTKPCRANIASGRGPSHIYGS